MTEQKIEAGIELNENSRIVGVWFIGEPDGIYDWMACIWRDDPTADWRVSSRLRYRVDDRIWGSRDRKDWGAYRIPAAETEEQIISDMVSVTRRAAAQLGIDPKWIEPVIVRGGMEDFMKLVASKPWFSQRQVDNVEEQKEQEPQAKDEQTAAKFEAEVIEVMAEMEHADTLRLTALHIAATILRNGELVGVRGDHALVEAVAYAVVQFRTCEPDYLAVLAEGSRRVLLTRGARVVGGPETIIDHEHAHDDVVH